MATAADIIKRSLRLINALAAGETPDATQQADCLEALNAMIDAWRNESLMVYALQDESFAVNGAASYTIGSGGTFNTTRPVKIESAFIRHSGVDYPVAIAGADAWFGIADKTTASDYPDWLYYEPSMSLGKIFLYPIPSAGTLHLITWVPIAELSASTTITLPPGYREALTYQLAMRLGPEYGRAVPVEVAAVGKAAKKDIKRVNFRVPHMETGFDRGSRYNVFADS